MKEPSTHNGESTGSLINSVENTGQSHAKNETEPLPTAYTNINSKQIKELKLGPEYKTSRIKHRRQLLGISPGNYFLTLRTKATKAKINKWDYIKIKSLLTAKETIYKIRRLAME